MKKNGNGKTMVMPEGQLKGYEPGQSGNGSINREIVHRQILESTAKMAWLDDLPQEALEKIWAQRAAQIAREINGDEQDELIELALFKLGSEVYALDVHNIIDLRSLDRITRVPRVPAWVSGVVNLRGRIISVVDLKRFLGLPSLDCTSGNENVASRLVVVETSEMELVLLVDEVLEIESIPTARVQESTGAIRGIQPEFVRGIVVRKNNGKEKTDGDLSIEEDPKRGNHSILVILNLRALLSSPKLIIHEEII